jgi:DMSO/TMAO reductase YedYZ heme-binding membrane subunit
MGAGTVLLLLGSYINAKGVAALLDSVGGMDKRSQARLRWQRLRFWCVLAGVIGLVGLSLSTGGVNYRTVGFSCVAAGALLAAVIGRGLIYGPSAGSDSMRLLAAAGGIFGIIVSGVTLILQLSGASDSLTRWNPYSQLGAAGLAASLLLLLYLAITNTARNPH